MQLVLFNKPFQVLPQFTSPDGRRCLADFLSLPGLYPAGRLDYDSEGLMLLTDFGPWQARISQPGSPLVQALPGAGRGRSHGRRARALATGSHAERRPDPPGAGARNPRARGTVAARPTHPQSQGDSHRLDRARTERGPEPTGPTDDGSGRLADIATHTLGGGALDGRRACARASARPVSRTEAEAALSAGRRALPTVRPNGQRSRSASRVRGPVRN